MAAADFKDSMISSVTASSSYDLHGAEIREGAAKSRISLIEKNPRFNIAAEIVKGGLWESILVLSGRFVKIDKPDGTKLLLNINSVASRLHLTKSEVKEILAKEGGLAALKERASRISYIFERAKKTDYSGEVDEDKLRGFLERINTVKKGEQIVYHESANGEKGLLKISQKLGSGAFGVAYSVEDALEKNGGELALKLAKSQQEYEAEISTKEPELSSTDVAKEASKRTIEAKNDIEMEYTLLTKIHAEGECPGIMAAPKKIIHLAASEAVGGKTVGYLVEKYSEDYSAHNESDRDKSGGLPTTKAQLEDKLYEFYQLLQGLNALRDKGIAHGDLKERNILFKRTQEGDNRVYISDFGGARKADELTELGSLTAHYCNKGDIHKLAELYEKYHVSTHPNEKRSLLTEIKNLEFKRDVFAMGVVLYEALEGKPPYPLDLKTGFQDASYQEFNTMTSAAPDALKSLIKIMLDPSSLHRIPANQSLREMDRIVNAHPEVKERLIANELMKAPIREPAKPRRVVESPVKSPAVSNEPIPQRSQPKVVAAAPKPAEHLPPQISPQQKQTLEQLKSDIENLKSDAPDKKTGDFDEIMTNLSGLIMFIPELEFGGISALKEQCDTFIFNCVLYENKPRFLGLSSSRIKFVREAKEKVEELLVKLKEIDPTKQVKT